MLKNLYDLESIRTDNYRNLDVSTVHKLVSSILAVGLQEPIQLFHINETKEYYVVSGHHRLEAMKIIKSDPRHENIVFQAEVVRGSLMEYRSQHTAVKSVMANSMRKDMILVDRAKAYAKLLSAGLDVDVIALMVDKEVKIINKTLLVAKLPDEVLSYIQSTPKIRDSIVYKFAAKYQEEPDFDVLKALQSLAHNTMQRKGANAKQVRVNREVFLKKLLDSGEFNTSQISTIKKALSNRT